MKTAIEQRRMREREQNKNQKSAAKKGCYKKWHFFMQILYLERPKIHTIANCLFTMEYKNIYRSLMLPDASLSRFKYVDAFFLFPLTFHLRGHSFFLIYFLASFLPRHSFSFHCGWKSFLHDYMYYNVLALIVPLLLILDCRVPKKIQRNDRIHPVCASVRVCSKYISFGHWIRMLRIFLNLNVFHKTMGRISCFE